MTKFYKLLKFSIFLLILTFGKTIAQPCYNASAYGTANVSTYNSTMVNITTCNYAGEYATINTSVGGVFTFSDNIATDYLTLATGVSSGSIISGFAPITATLTPGTYYLHVALNSTCGTQSTCRATSFSNTALPGSPTLVTSPVNSMVCSGLPVVFTASATGASTLQWQSSTSPSGPWTNLTNTPPFSGVNTQTLTINPTSNTLNATYYQLAASNSISAVTSTAALLTVIQSTTVPLIEDFNSSLTMPTAWLNNPSYPFYVFSNHGTGGTNGMSRELYFGPDYAIAQTPNIGVITASTSLKFDYRIVDWSGYPSTATSTVDLALDSLGIYISTDCGTTFTLLGSIDASNHIPSTSFTTKSYNLAAYAGSSAIIKFRAAYDGASMGDYYVDIDNVNVYNAVPIDGGVSAFSQPAAGQPCYGSTQPVVVSISNYGTSPLTSVPVDVHVSGALTTTVSGTYSGSIPPSGSTSFTVGTVNMSAAGTYSFKAFTKILGDPTQTNDTLLPIVTRTVVPTSTIPYSESFAGLTAPPVAWTTNPSNPWYVTMNHGTAGSEGMYRNLYGSFAIKAETTLMPLGPVTASTALSFDYRYQDWSGFPSSPATPTASLIYDTLAVKISTNCGLSFSTLASISGANHIASTTHANKTYSLGAFAGSNVILKFVATKSSTTSADYYIDVDNINIYNAVAIDGGVSAFSQPATGQPCYGSTQQVVVSINNFGSSPLTSVPVDVHVSGALTTTVSGTYSGSIPPSGSTSFTVGTVNMSAAGTYSFKAFTKILGDPTQTNDTLLPIVTRTVVPTSTIPYSESFAGLTAPPVAWTTNPSNPWYVTMNHGTAGSEGMYRNLYGSFAIKAETTLMPLGPVTASTALSFDYRYQDWSGFPSSPATPTASLIYDTLAVKISTNCGYSYSTLASISGANHVASTTHANKTYSLGAYAGSNVILKFVATKSSTTSADYYVDVDNINLFNLSAVDGGVSALVTPGTSTCTSSSQPVVVTITNYGLGPITNVPVSVILSGPAAQTITSTFTGTVPVGSSVNYTVGNGNFSAGGTYTINSSTNLSGDGNNLNNNNFSTFTTANPIVSIVGSTVACLGSTITLNSGGTATSYTWSTGANSTSISVSPSVATTYSLVGANSLSCTATSIFSVSVTNPTITGVGASGCGAPANGTLTANGFASSTVNWYATPSSTTSLGMGTTYTTSAVTTTTYYAEAQSVANGTAVCTMTAGNGSSGNMFDIVATSNIEVNGFDVHISSTAITTVEVWYRPGSFVGFNTSNSGWTNALTTTVTGMGTGSLTLVPATFTVPVSAGSTFGFYVTANGGGSFAYSNGTAVGNIHVSNGDLNVLEGNGGSYFSVTNSPRVFNGRVRYTKVGCTSPRIPVVFTVTPSASVTAMASNTAVCIGNSSTLTASGAPSYTWNPGNMTGSVVVVSPTVATTYTVLGGSGTCSGTAVQALTVNPSPAISIIASQSICTGVMGVTTLTTSSPGNTFTWSPGNSNNTTIVIPNPTVTTVYSVTATHPQGCKAIVTTSIIVQNCAGVNEKSIADNTLIYPNPTNGLVHVSLSQGINNCELIIYDVTGRKVKSVRINQSEANVNLKDFANGLYTYKIISNTNTIIKEGKIVKE